MPPHSKKPNRQIPLDIKRVEEEVEEGLGDLNEDGLSSREATFVKRLLIHNNQCKAAREAGYKPSNCNSAAQRLLNETPRVMFVLARERKKIADRFDVSRESLIKELAYLSKSRIRNHFDEGGNSLLPMSELAEEDAAAIQSVEVSDIYEGRGEDRAHVGHLKKIKLGDKRAAIETLAKIQGYMKDTNVDAKKDRLQEMVDALRKQS